MFRGNVIFCKWVKFEFEIYNDLYVFLFFIGFYFKENLLVFNWVKFI